MCLSRIVLGSAASSPLPIGERCIEVAGALLHEQVQLIKKENR